MMSSPLVAVIVWAALAAWLGQLVGPKLGISRPGLVERLVIGLVLLHAWMLLLDAVGVPWTRATLLGPAALAAFMQWRVGPSPKHGDHESGRIPDRRGLSLVLADVVALGAVAGFASYAWSLRSLAPDFIYHWGLKGRHFAAEGGVSWALLRGHDASYLHPDYPLFVPNLYAATELLSGLWNEPALAVWSVLYLALLVWEMRCVADEVLGGVWGHAAYASGALVLSAFSIGHLQAGAADIPFALAVLALARQLWRLGEEPARGQTVARIGVWSAFAVVCKIEGYPLAALAVALTWLRCHGLRLGALPGWLVRRWVVWMPTAVLGGGWIFTMWSRGLYQATNSGRPSWERAQLTFEALPAALSVSTWSGLAWLLPLLPLGLLLRGPRWLVLLPCLQIAFYLSSYVGGAQSTTFWVVSSFPRLVFHVMPVLWIGIWWATRVPASTAHGGVPCRAD